MVRLRLKRVGRKNRACYRICAFDQRTRRDGKPIEELGRYDPLMPDESRQISLNRERIIHWLDVGAQPTDTVGSILRKHGIDPTPGRRGKS
ncbi:MAG: 30S ribosomal protein S16 [Planctomycetota bacterium]|jgi:small subunit ribosomal protein S16|nr:30S ribosomal protein S16 [Planctomycetota bacterium]MDP7134916.1 30S ribosomal protein S16 [Planctomycetota bacterium]MDP7252459.1 30S ribosomal protein S16 [Planctomycetota bacterium]